MFRHTKAGDFFQKGEIFLDFVGIYIQFFEMVGLSDKGKQFAKLKKGSREEAEIREWKRETGREDDFIVPVFRPAALLYICEEHF